MARLAALTTGTEIKMNAVNGININNRELQAGLRVRASRSFTMIELDI